ncbi:MULTISPECIES: hypothetical protein [unclassified Anabaena]
MHRRAATYCQLLVVLYEWVGDTRSVKSSAYRHKALTRKTVSILI